MRTIRKKSSLSLYRQRTNYRTNRWNTCITWRARRSSCSDVIVPERYASYNALIFCEWHHTSLAFLAGGQPISAWRIAEAVTHSSRLRCFTITKRFRWAARTPRLKRACHDSTALLLRSCESTEYSLVPQLNRERTGQPSVREVCVELFYCGVISVLLMQWCGKGVNLIRRQKSQGHVGLNIYQIPTLGIPAVRHSGPYPANTCA